jgi:FkbM family methyltransferase
MHAVNYGFRLDDHLRLFILSYSKAAKKGSGGNMIGSAFRLLARQFGYVLWKRAYLRYGVDAFLDVERLSKTWNRPLDVVFDVGANAGQTARAALAAFPGAHIFSFEPHPKVFAELKANIRDKRATLNDLALGAEAGEVMLYEYGDKGGGASLRNSLVPNARSALQFGYTSKPISVRCTTLDQFCIDRGIAHIGLLKIDVEGFELSVLKGAHDMLRRGQIGFIYLEYNDLYPAPNASGGSLLELSDYLREFGYRFITNYTDFLSQGNSFFVVANALFAIPPSDAAR